MFLDATEYFENPSDDYLKLKGRYSEIDGFRVLDASELPPGVEFGTTYKTWCLNPPVYCSWLERQLNLGGVQIVSASLVAILEVFPTLRDIDSRIVINCSGIGFSDPEVFPTRGIMDLGNG